MFHISKYTCVKGFVSHSYEYQIAIKLFFNLLVLFRSVRKRQRRIFTQGSYVRGYLRGEIVPDAI